MLRSSATVPTVSDYCIVLLFLAAVTRSLLFLHVSATIFFITMSNPYYSCYYFFSWYLTGPEGKKLRMFIGIHKRSIDVNFFVYTKDLSSLYYNNGVVTGTWNTANPSGDLDKFSAADTKMLTQWIPTQGYDMIALGFQECDVGDWTPRMLQHIGTNYMVRMSACMRCTAKRIQPPLFFFHCCL